MTPYKAHNFCSFAVIFYADSFFFFGGKDHNNLYLDDKLYHNAIVRLHGQSFKWDKVGTLYSNRYGHNVIEQNGQFLIVGGNNADSGGQMKTELCKYENGQMTCRQQAPILAYYEFYPELFLVNTDFCQP